MRKWTSPVSALIVGALFVFVGVVALAQPPTQRSPRQLPRPVNFIKSKQDRTIYAKIIIDSPDRTVQDRKDAQRVFEALARAVESKDFRTKVAAAYANYATADLLNKPRIVLELRRDDPTVDVAQAVPYVGDANGKYLASSLQGTIRLDMGDLEKLAAFLRDGAGKPLTPDQRDQFIAEYLIRILAHEIDHLRATQGELHSDPANDGASTGLPVDDANQVITELGLLYDRKYYGEVRDVTETKTKNTRKHVFVRFERNSNGSSTKMPPVVEFDYSEFLKSLGRSKTSRSRHNVASDVLAGIDPPEPLATPDACAGLYQGCSATPCCGGLSCGASGACDLVDPTATESACASDSDCDDDNACSEDVCRDGACLHVGRTGATCDDGDPSTTADACRGPSCAGALSVCDGDAECDDADPCTADSCVDGYCIREVITEGACGTCKCGDPGVTLTNPGGCDFPDATACSGWKSVVHENKGGDPKGEFADGSTFSAFGCTIRINCGR